MPERTIACVVTINIRKQSTKDTFDGEDLLEKLEELENPESPPDQGGPGGSQTKSLLYKPDETEAGIPA